MSVKGEAGMALKSALESGDGEAIAAAFEALNGACSYEDEDEKEAPPSKPAGLILAIGSKGKK